MISFINKPLAKLGIIAVAITLIWISPTTVDANICAVPNQYSGIMRAYVAISGMGPDSCSLSDYSPPSVEATQTVEDNPFLHLPKPDDTLFGKRWYGRLADFANVYAEPTRSATIVRNVGDGYLFATVNRWFKNADGEEWYEINAGEFVHESDIQLVNPTDFQGVFIQNQPVRPFGWVVQDVTPSAKPNGEPIEALDELPRLTFIQIYDAQIGNDDWIWYDIGEGLWVRQTYLSLVDVSGRPEEVGPNEYWTEVDLYEQTFAAYVGDQMVYATLISSGLNYWPTREGVFQVWERLREYKMSGAEGRSDYYFLEDIPYIMYFDQLMGIAFHGTYWHDRFGYKHSHGCVNMSILDAEWVYNWSADAPNDLWVWVHTSDPKESPLLLMP